MHKHGFEEQEMRALMEANSLIDFGWREMPDKVELKMHEGDPVIRKVFVARGTKHY